MSAANDPVIAAILARLDALEGRVSLCQANELARVPQAEANRRTGHSDLNPVFSDQGNTWDPITDTWTKP